MGEAGKQVNNSELESNIQVKLQFSEKSLQNQEVNEKSVEHHSSSSNSSEEDTRTKSEKSKKKKKQKKKKEKKSDKDTLKEALKAEEDNQKQADYLLSLDERKRPYNSMFEVKKPSEEELEAYYLKRRREEDPMSQFL